MTTIVTTTDIDLDDSMTVIRLAMDITGAETLGELTTYCKIRSTSPRALVEAAVVRIPEDTDLDLSLGAGHTLTVHPTLWDDARRCIALVYDGTHDHSTPALTAAEARSLAAALIATADELES